MLKEGSQETFLGIDRIESTVLFSNRLSAADWWLGIDAKVKQETENQDLHSISFPEGKFHLLPRMNP